MYRNSEDNLFWKIEASLEVKLMSSLVPNPRVIRIDWLVINGVCRVFKLSQERASCIWCPTAVGHGGEWRRQNGFIVKSLNHTAVVGVMVELIGHCWFNQNYWHLRVLRWMGSRVIRGLIEHILHPITILHFIGQNVTILFDSKSSVVLNVASGGQHYWKQHSVRRKMKAQFPKRKQRE